MIDYFCYICFSTTDEEYLCDFCNEHYCYDCSYTYSLHFQYQGSSCYNCVDQSRRNILTKEERRNNYLKMILNKNNNYVKPNNN